MRLAPGAWRLAAIPLVGAVPLALLAPVVGVVAFALGLGTLAFFRDPDRSPPASGLLVPADGRVSVLRQEGDRVRVGVFMNVWNVHVVRSPAAGVVADATHHPGAHRPAFTKDSDRNERLVLELERDGEPPLEVTLIAGAFARRIHPYVEAGTAVDRGERIGHIAFGSRVDVLLPPDVNEADLTVTVGDRVRAGETVLY